MTVLAPDEVQLWVADLLPDPAESARRLAANTDDERDRATWFWRGQDGARYLSAHGALRLVLAECMSCDPVALRFTVGDHGKPFLAGAPLEFNLSHSGDLALIAVARGRRVGVDVECLRPMPNVEDLAHRVCSPDELAVLSSLEGQARDEKFLAVWTRKEALAKATGEGIQAVMRDSQPDADSWTVVNVSDLPGYVASVAGEGRGWRLVRRDATPSGSSSA